MKKRCVVEVMARCGFKGIYRCGAYARSKKALKMKKKRNTEHAMYNNDRNIGNLTKTISLFKPQSNARHIKADKCLIRCTSSMCGYKK